MKSFYSIAVTRHFLVMVVALNCYASYAAIYLYSMQTQNRFEFIVPTSATGDGNGSLKPVTPMTQPSHEMETEPNETAPASSSFRAIILQAAKRHSLEPALIQAVIMVESSCNPTAVSNRGAKGLMQLMPATAAEMGVKDSFNPEQNVHGGARYLRELLERYRGDAIRALAAYNAGPDAVDRYNGVPPYPETLHYVQKVVRDYNRKKSRVVPAKKDGRHKASPPPASLVENR